MSGKNGFQALDPVRSPDKIFAVMVALAAIAGMALSLASAGYLLAFNVHTLLMSTVIFTLGGMQFILHAKPAKEQVKYVALAAVPIALRILFNLPFFRSYQIEQPVASYVPIDLTTQLIFTVQVIGLWILVAVCEEAFRASMMTLWEAIYRIRHRQVNVWLQILFANVLWILFHFIQRPLDPFAYKYYIAWLFVSGIVMGYVLHKAGLGAAAMIHFIVNLTA